MFGRQDLVAPDNEGVEALPLLHTKYFVEDIAHGFGTLRGISLDALSFSHPYCSLHLCPLKDECLEGYCGDECKQKDLAVEERYFNFIVLTLLGLARSTEMYLLCFFEEHGKDSRCKLT